MVGLPLDIEKKTGRFKLGSLVWDCHIHIIQDHVYTNKQFGGFKFKL